MSRAGGVNEAFILVLLNFPALFFGSFSPLHYLRKLSECHTNYRMGKHMAPLDSPNALFKTKHFFSALYMPNRLNGADINGARAVNGASMLSPAGPSTVPASSQVALAVAALAARQQQSQQQHQAQQQRIAHTTMLQAMPPPLSVPELMSLMPLAYQTSKCYKSTLTLLSKSPICPQQFCEWTTAASLIIACARPNRCPKRI